MANELSRRQILTAAGALGCTLAASPFLTPVTLASAPWQGRLVVIILRGGMDGLDVVQPYGDPDLLGLRPGFNLGPAAGAVDLDGFFAMHAGLAPLTPLWQAGELGFVHAVSTPYRDKRSHFDGQDLLEAGTVGLGEARDGWLNRMLQMLPGVSGQTAYAIGRGEMKLMAGAAPVANWSPEAELALSPQAERLAQLIMQDDPAFEAALAEALMLSDTDGGMAGSKGGGHIDIARFAADALNAQARVAAFSLNGWDTHARQARGLSRALRRLSETILTLQAALEPSVWGQTAVLAVTEFGRTAQTNGTGGTDHGTGGAMVMAGGAIRGGRVHGMWPGLAEVDLYDRRDLMPTADLRAQVGWIMRGLTGLDRSLIEQTVFPGVELAGDPGLLR